MNKSSEPGTVVVDRGESSGSCWSCGDMRAAQFCRSCGKVQPPAPVDYFSFFGLARKLNIESAGLEKEFYELSRYLHPDLSARGNPEEQSWSLEQSSRLNDAYRTLKDPIRRTRYLLSLEGVELEEQSKSATEAARVSGGVKKQIVPPDLLEEVFELNMQLEELRMQKQSGEDDPALTEGVAKQKQALEARYEAVMDDLRDQWAIWDRALESADEEAQHKVRDKMVDLLNRRNYIGNLVRDINLVLDAA